MRGLESSHALRAQDPRGEKLLQCKEPLAEASKLLGVLKRHAAQRLSTHEAAFEVALLQDKPFLAVHAVKHAVHLDGDAPAAHCLLVRLVLWLASRTRCIEPDIAAEVLAEEASALTGARHLMSACYRTGADAATCTGVCALWHRRSNWQRRAAGDRTAIDINESFQRRHADAGVSYHLAVAQMQAHINPESTAAAAAVLARVDLGSPACSPVGDCETALRWLQIDAKAADAASAFFKRAQRLHRWSSVFEGCERNHADAAPAKENHSADAIAERFDALQPA